MLDLEKSTTDRKRFALILQAKVADETSASGQFTLSTQEEATQRQFYVRQPDFTLTKPKPYPSDFNIRPSVAGQCPGMRYACVNVNAVVPSSGWWIEDKQPVATLVTPSASPTYTGTFNANVPLGEALHGMVTGLRGALLKPDGEWKRLIKTVEQAAHDRTARGQGPSGVHATASGTVRANVAAASLFLTNANEFFDSKATMGFQGNWKKLGGATKSSPPSERPPLESVEPQGSGFFTSALLTRSGETTGKLGLGPR
ncbi:MULTISPECIES: hypothetical protein [Paraburkholderia]|uniref:hypothetical protein n=1 Tax=Paraburkholderia TaxID=1822464 RepID=UPI0022569C94|nr:MULTISPECIES: hypothetical protein [Paraburkholderia]MCX4163589.1 hypothetical protein [Paraburkholderia megapolitana]MDN7159084.1 hypothetical protein [Paraburkholderia sp. CHISQ3]MDQ6496131.1 hypothetical protein [Paraburkholderia megapolitana]